MLRLSLFTRGHWQYWKKPLETITPRVATSLANMADLYKKIGKEDEAKRLEERAEGIRSRNQ